MNKKKELKKEIKKLKSKLKKERAKSLSQEIKIDSLIKDTELLHRTIDDLGTMLQITQDYISIQENENCGSNEDNVKIRNIIFDGDNTTITWSDGSSTLSKRVGDDLYDARTGIAMCLAKRFKEGQNLTLFEKVLTLSKEEKKMLSCFHDLKSSISEVCESAIDKWEYYTAEGKRNTIALYKQLKSAGLFEYAYIGRTFLLFEGTDEETEVVLNKTLMKDFRKELGFIFTKDIETLAQDIVNIAHPSSEEISEYINEVLETILEDED